MKRSILLYLLIVFCISTQAQNNKIAYGDESYQYRDYFTAIIYYEGALRDLGELPDTTLVKLANCYYYVKYYETAIEYFQTVDESVVAPSYMVNYADLLQNYMGNYEYAEVYYTLAIEDGITDPLVIAKRNSCLWALDHVEDFIECEVSLFDIDTKGLSFGTSFYKNGIVYSYSPNVSLGENIVEAPNNEYFEVFDFKKMDLYYSTFNNEGLLETVSFADGLNSNLHQGAVCFNSGFSTMYFTRFDKSKAVELLHQRNAKKSKIYSSDHKRGNWTKPKEMPFNSDSYNCAYPALSADGNILVFASDMPGGKGGMDLYYSKKGTKRWGTKVSWSKPVNLGDLINTAGDEVYPVLTKTGKLYFSSNGQPGFGGLDIFMAIGTLNNWSLVINLLKPINSNFDDFSFSPNPSNPKQAFLSSNRDDLGSTDNIYYVLNAPSFFHLKATVVDSNSKDSINESIITVSDTKSGEILYHNSLYENPSIDQVLNDVEGRQLKIVVVRDGYEKQEVILPEGADSFSYLFELTPIEGTSSVASSHDNSENKPVEVMAVNDDRSNQDMVVTEPTSDFNEQKPIQIEKTDLGMSGKVVDDQEVIQLVAFDVFTKEEMVFGYTKIYFKHNSSKLTRNAMIKLNHWGDVLKDNPYIEIELRGHTCSKGSVDFNKSLSKARAMTAKGYLVSNHFIHPKRIVARGYGEEFLLNNCPDGVDCTEEEHAKNRRVEVKITKDP